MIGFVIKIIFHYSNGPILGEEVDCQSWPQWINQLNQIAAFSFEKCLTSSLHNIGPFFGLSVV